MWIVHVREGVISVRQCRLQSNLCAVKMREKTNFETHTAAPLLWNHQITDVSVSSASILADCWHFNMYMTSGRWARAFYFRLCQKWQCIDWVLTGSTPHTVWYPSNPALMKSSVPSIFDPPLLSRFSWNSFPFEGKKQLSIPLPQSRCR